MNDGFALSRVDRLPSGGIEVIDYKTGRVSSQKGVDEGLQLDLRRDLLAVDDGAAYCAGRSALTTTDPLEAWLDRTGACAR